MRPYSLIGYYIKVRTDFFKRWNERYDMKFAYTPAYVTPLSPPPPSPVHKYTHFQYTTAPDAPITDINVQWNCISCLKLHQWLGLLLNQICFAAGGGFAESEGVSPSRFTFSRFYLEKKSKKKSISINVWSRIYQFVDKKKNRGSYERSLERAAPRIPCDWNERADGGSSQPAVQNVGINAHPTRPHTATMQRCNKLCMPFAHPILQLGNKKWTCHNSQRPVKQVRGYVMKCFGKKKHPHKNQGHQKTKPRHTTPKKPLIVIQHE